LLLIGVLFNLRLLTQTQLVGQWKFDEASGTTASDASGNGHSATLVGGPSWTVGKVAGAVNLSGSGQWVDTNASLLDTSGDYSVSAWLLLYRIDGWFTAVSQDGTNVSSFYLQHTHPDQGGRFALTSHSSDSTNNPGAWARSSA